MSEGNLLPETTEVPIGRAETAVYPSQIGAERAAPLPNHVDVTAAPTLTADTDTPQTLTSTGNDSGDTTKTNVQEHVELSTVLNYSDYGASTKKSISPYGSDDRRNPLLGSLGSSTSVPARLLGQQDNLPQEKIVSHEEYTLPSSGVQRVKRQHCWLFLVFLLIALVLAVGGGIAIGFTNRHFTMQLHQTSLEVKNRVVLNSSLLGVQNYQSRLSTVNTQLTDFVELHTEGMDPSQVTVVSLRDALEDSFLESWDLWLNDDQTVDTVVLRIPFCPDDQVGTVTCPQMVLSVNCTIGSATASSWCWFGRNTDSGLSVETFELIKNEKGMYELGSRLSSFVDSYLFYPNQTGSKRPLYLVPQNVVQMDGIVDTVIPLRHQSYLFPNNPSSTLVLIVDTVVYMKNWFDVFDRDLQKASESYSLLFVNDSIIEYSLGESVEDGIPCKLTKGDFFLGETNYTGCGGGGAKELDNIVENFEKHYPSSILTDEVYKNGDYSQVERVGNLLVAYQDFVRFRTGLGMPNVVFFAAYATPINNSLGKEGAIQIVICVVVIIVCIFALGALTFAITWQLQRVIITVSSLATHAATYDTCSMERELQKLNEKRSCVTRAFSSFDVVHDEFNRILLNLNRYRLFIPQALLMKDAAEELDNDPSSETEGAGREEQADDLENTRAISKTDVTSSQMVVGEDKVNKLLNLSALRRVKGTILVARLLNLSADEKNAAAVMNFFVGSVLSNVAAHNGVVDVIEANMITVSFNCHYTVLRHQQRACKCALGIKEDFKDSPYDVVIGIASGFSYVGTIGTEDQRARVVTSDFVRIARALTTLQPFVDSTILATETVTFESTSAYVPIDIVSLFYNHTSEWQNYVICAVMGDEMSHVPEAMMASKKILRLIRNKRYDTALMTVQSYIDATTDKKKVPWSIKHWEYILKHHKDRVLAGYSRREIIWEHLEGEQVIYEQMKPFLAKATKRVLDMKTEEERKEKDETTKAKEILGEQAIRISASRRIMNNKQMNDSGDALFPVFTQDEDEESISNDANTDPSVPASSSRRLNHSVNEGPSELPLKIEGVNGQFYYRSNKVLGRGAFGDVYLAVGETGAFFALKTIVVTINSTEQLVHEVEALTKLRNENVVAYDTCGVDGTYFFIITEYLSAGSMQDLVQRLGVIPVKAIRRYCRDILMGLHFLHENKYNHCDIKPDNILLTSEGTCKLADFGAAVLQFSTHKPSIRGTPRFMAPEAVLGVFTPQSDVYSFGLSVVQMMTGKHPWHHYPDGDSMFLVKYTGALRESLEKKTPCTMQPDLPKEYEDVELLQMVQRCCAYAPEERPTVAELLTFLS